MSVSFNFERDKVNRKGLRPIQIRVTIDRELWRVKTDIAVKDSDWNPDKQEVRRCCPEYAVINDRLSSKKKAIEDLYYDLEARHGRVSLKMLRQVYEGNDDGSMFLPYVRRRIDDMVAQGNRGNSRQYNDFYQKFSDYLVYDRIERLCFDDITVDVMQDFERYLQRLPNATHKDKRLAPNTIHRVMKVFKALINDAVREGKIAPNNNPLPMYEMPRTVKTSKEKLTNEEIQMLQELDLPVDSRLWHCRNYFLFSLYNAGIRVEDICLLKMSNVEVEAGHFRLIYSMKKVSKSINSKQIPQAEKILRYYWSKDKSKDDYLFPILSRYGSLPKFSGMAGFKQLSIQEQADVEKKIDSQETLINKALRELAKMAGIEKHISFHVSRHTYARKAIQSGLSVRELQGTLNHSESKTTEIYIGELDLNTIDSAIEKVFADDNTNRTRIQRALENCKDEDLTDETTARILEILHP